jgi:Cu+-exporting ATPase
VVVQLGASRSTVPAAPQAPFDVELAVRGMTCAACAARVQRRLDRMDGVRARVSYASERASIHAAPGISVASLIGEVERAGYTASEIISQSTLSDAQLDRETRVRDLQRRFLVALVLSMPVCDLSLGWPVMSWLRTGPWPWLLLAMTAPIVTWSAWPFHRATLRGARHGASSMDTLVSLGITASVGWSLWVMFGASPVSSAATNSLAVILSPTRGLYLEVAAGVTTFLLMGRLFEARAKRAAGGTLRSLASMTARDVTVLEAAGGERQVPVEQLQVGDRFVVRPGETIATDGNVVGGASSVDCSRMTGESAPVEAIEGTAVLGGTIVLQGRLVVSATRVGADTQLAQMVHLVEQAQADKADAQRLADRISSVFVPLVLVIAAVTFTGWLVSGAASTQAFAAGIAVLIIACPCALGLATPTALMVASGVAAERGIFIKGYQALEAAHSVDTVVLDKTGTLTTGLLDVVDLALGPDVDRNTALSRAGALEAASQHPIGAAVTVFARADLARTQPAVLPQVTDFNSLTGYGVSGWVDGAHVLVGREELFTQHDYQIPTWADQLRQRWETQGRSIVMVGWDGSVHALLAVTDTLKPSAPAAVRALRDLGLQVVLLTGDNAAVAHSVAEQVGITEVTAQVLPAAKGEVIRRLQNQGHRVAMVGDGVNDAPALSIADLGLAIGSGTDLARGAADLILIRDDLDVLPLAIRLSRSTLRTIHGNLLWAFGYNVAAIPLAASGLLNPLIGGLAMTLSSMFVLTNSLRLQRTYGLAGSTGALEQEPEERNQPREEAGLSEPKQVQC